MSDNTTTKETAPEPQKSKSVVFILIGVLVLILGGGGAWFFLRHNKTAEAAPQQETAPKYTLPLESFTVNLSDPEDSHFLRITVNLGLGKPAKTEKDSESEFPTARVRDAVLTVLTAGKANTLVTPEGKEQLKKDLINALQAKVPEIDVRDVYFTEFLVQR